MSRAQPEVDDTLPERIARWRRIDWSPALPADFVFPERYFGFDHDDFLDRPARVALNHLAVCFSCEQAIHFEHLLIRFIERRDGRLPGVAPGAVQRLLDEEKLHIGAFYQVVEKLRPDLYPARSLRWLRWIWFDSLLVRMTPMATFFTLALLLEEITVYIPVAIDEHPGESFAPVAAVMQLHAREERGHVGIDARVLETLQASRPRWWLRLQVLLCLPLLFYVDRRIKGAWRRAVDQFLIDRGIDRARRRRLRRRGSPRSDVLGIRSFVARMQGSPLPGARTLCEILARQVP